MAKYTPLEQWIAQALSEPDRESPCTAMALMYLKHGGGNREVKTINLKGKSHDAKDLAKIFQGLAEQYAQDFGGIQQFEMQAFYGSSAPGLHHTITVMEGELQQGGRGRTVKETPDGQGQVAQAMRHTENITQLLVNLIQTGAVTSLQREQAMAEREARLRDEVNDAYGIVREMMMQKATENHEQRMRELQFKQSATERKALVGMVPALVNTVSGRDIFPQSTSDTALIDSMAEEVKPEAIQQLAAMGLIPPKLLGPLMARFEEATRKKQMEEEEAKKLIPSSIDPRDDASGGPIQ
jgi:choline dehydrogenase-like flavoprotein